MLPALGQAMRVINQAWKCALGYACELSGVRGYGLQDGDQIRIMTNCEGGNANIATDLRNVTTPGEVAAKDPCSG